MSLLARSLTVALLAATPGCLVGCRDDVVARLSLAGHAEQFVEGSFKGRSGVDYQLWADYEYEPPLESKDPKFCYDVHFEVVQGGSVVASSRCYSVPHSGTCIGTYGNGSADCQMKCAFELAKDGEATLRAKLTKGEPCDTAYAGLTDPDRQMRKYQLLLEEDD